MIFCNAIFILRNMSESGRMNAGKGGPPVSNASAYRNRWISKVYDRINLTVPKGKKALIQAHADQRGESVNAFINRAIGEAMERERNHKAELT